MWFSKRKNCVLKVFSLSLYVFMKCLIHILMFSMFIEKIIYFKNEVYKLKFLCDDDMNFMYVSKLLALFLS